MSQQRYEYQVRQIILKERVLGTGSGNVPSLEAEINRMARQGWKLHTIECSSSGSKGFLGGDRTQALCVFERQIAS